MIPVSIRLKMISLAMVPGMWWAFEREMMGMVAYLWVLGMAVFLVSRGLEYKPYTLTSVERSKLFKTLSGGKETL